MVVPLATFQAEKCNFTLNRKFYQKYGIFLLFFQNFSIINEKGENLLLGEGVI